MVPLCCKAINTTDFYLFAFFSIDIVFVVLYFFKKGDGSKSYHFYTSRSGNTDKFLSLNADLRGNKQN